MAPLVISIEYFDRTIFVTCKTMKLLLQKCDWILENRPNCHTGRIPQLMAILVHNTYTVSLPGLVDLYAFLERVLPTL